MVDMDDIVADLKLLDFLEGEGSLTTTSLVGAQRVFMEAVEDLMVGKNTAVVVVVDEASVEGGGDIMYGSTRVF